MNHESQATEVEPDEPVPRLSSALEEVASPASGPITSQDRRLFYFMAFVLGAVVLGLFWLALRSNTQQSVREAMDFAFQLGLGGVLVIAGFGLLLLFPFRIAELLAIVIVLSFLMKVILQTLDRLKTSGTWAVFFGESSSGGAGAGLGLTLELCMIAACLFLTGAAWGLRHCVVLKIENTFSRVFAVIAGMLVIPSAAGFFVFPVMVLKDALSRDGFSEDSSTFLVGWAISVLATILNSYYLIRTMTLRE
jgi:hypothetical protein